MSFSLSLFSFETITDSVVEAVSEDDTGEQSVTLSTSVQVRKISPTWRNNLLIDLPLLANEEGPIIVVTVLRD